MNNLRIVYITNIPAPYRERMHELMADQYGADYLVIYCSRKEPNRLWTFKSGNYEQVFLTEEGNKMVHNNRNVWRYLKDFKPDVVISSGFNPTMLYAFAWAVSKRKKFIPYLDGTFDSEKGLSSIHRMVRKIVFRFSHSFVGTGKGTRRLYNDYGIEDKMIHDACLCIENGKFAEDLHPVKKYDLMFSGQLIERKMPLFFAEVVKKLKSIRGSISVLVIGDGPLREQLLNEFQTYGIEYDYPGFLQPDQLPDYYKHSKIFAFPTLNDPWGIVANEACAAGLPVITCPEAGVAGDLIVNGKNGYVIKPDVDEWVEHINLLLDDADHYHYISNNAIKMVQRFNHQTAVNGLEAAIDQAVNKNMVAEPSGSVLN